MPNSKASRPGAPACLAWLSSFRTAACVLTAHARHYCPLLSPSIQRLRSPPNCSSIDSQYLHTTVGSPDFPTELALRYYLTSSNLQPQGAGKTTTSCTPDCSGPIEPCRYPPSRILGATPGSSTLPPSSTHCLCHSSASCASPAALPVNCGSSKQSAASCSKLRLPTCLLSWSRNTIATSPSQSQAWFI